MTSDDKPLADPVGEGRRIVSLAAARGIGVKLFGGIAVAVTCKAAAHPALRRAYKDVDLARRRLGWWRTATEALGKVERYAASIADPDLAAGTAKEIERLRDQVEQTPKGLRWRTRAKIGDRARWYELPEEASG